MSHTINGFIGPVDELQRLTSGLKHAKIALLDVDGYGFLPYTHDLSAEIGKGWYDLGRKSKKTLVHVETDYFGGAGEQSAAVWKNGAKGYKAKKSGAIDMALRILGVVASEGNDEFDTLGLGNFRSNEDWAEKGNIASDQDEEERLEALRILDQLKEQNNDAGSSAEVSQ